MGAWTSRCSIATRRSNPQSPNSPRSVRITDPERGRDPLGGGDRGAIVTGQQLAITVTPEPDSVARARHFVRAAVGELTGNGPPADLAEVAELMVSELTANAVSLHAGEVTITVRCRDDCLRGEVRDFGYGRPEV